VPAEAQAEIRDAYWAIFDTEDLIAAGMRPGHDLVAAVQRRIDGFAEQYRRAFPSAVKCLLTDRAQLTSYLRFPAEHHRRIRHSNFIERTFGETPTGQGHRPAGRPARRLASTSCGPCSTEPAERSATALYVSWSPRPQRPPTEEAR